MGWILMSERELHRIEVLSKVVEGRMTLVSAAKGGQRMTQFGRALSELNIEILCTNSSQAKGRVERANRTLQDRLVKELRLAGISDMQAGRQCFPARVYAAV